MALVTMVPIPIVIVGIAVMAVIAIMFVVNAAAMIVLSDDAARSRQQ